MTKCKFELKEYIIRSANEMYGKWATINCPHPDDLTTDRIPDIKVCTACLLAKLVNELAQAEFN